jgi:hypothetical protein
LHCEALAKQLLALRSLGEAVWISDFDISLLNIYNLTIKAVWAIKTKREF